MWVIGGVGTDIADLPGGDANCRGSSAGETTGLSSWDGATVHSLSQIAAVAYLDGGGFFI